MLDFHQKSKKLTIEVMGLVKNAISFRKMNYYVFGIICVFFINFWMSLDLSSQPMIAVYNSGVLTFLIIVLSFMLFLETSDSILGVSYLTLYLYLIFDRASWVGIGITTLFVSILWLVCMKIVAMEVDDNVRGN